MRAIWTGSIAFGLVSIPVRLYAAVAPKDLRFREVDRRTGRRVRRRSVVVEEPPPYRDDDVPAAEPVEAGREPTPPTSDAAPEPAFRAAPSPWNRPAEREVERDEMVKAFEIEPGRVVEVEREEIEAARPEQTRVIEIERFVSLAEIDPVYFEKSYQLAPAEDLAYRPYGLLRTAMERSGRVAIGRFVLRTKEHLVAVRPTRGILGLETLYFGDEIVEPQAAWLAGVEEEPSERELKLSLALIDALAGDWDPEAFEDRDRARLMEIIEAKAPRDLPTEEPAIETGGASVPDLMEALRASVEAATKGRRRGKRRSG